MKQFNKLQNKNIKFIYKWITEYFPWSGGVIGSEPEPIESRQFSKDVNAAGILGSGKKYNETKTNYSSTPQPPGSTVPPKPPTTDENMIYGNFIFRFLRSNWF